MKKYSWIIILLVFILTPRLWADDTDIYGTTTISVTPNVLIIFDTSGSMSTKDVPGEYYDPNKTYSGSYTTNAVYEKSGGNHNQNYNQFADDIEDLNCPSVKTALQTDGNIRDEIQNSHRDYECGGNKRTLYLGSFLNYDSSGVGDFKTRTEVAKEVIEQLITKTDNVNFGLMRFNNDQGGRVLIGCGTADKATLINTVDHLPASDWTPLAETLAEAGLYFAGKKSWFNDGNGYDSYCYNYGNGCYQYTSPMQYRCQKNYIILMTDGEPTYDNSSKLSSGTYINGDTIGDYDHDGKDPGIMIHTDRITWTMWPNTFMIMI